MQVIFASRTSHSSSGWTVRRASLRRRRKARLASRRVQWAIERIRFFDRQPHHPCWDTYSCRKASGNRSEAADKVPQPHDVLSMLRVGVQEVHDRREYKLEHALSIVE